MHVVGHQQIHRLGNLKICQSPIALSSLIIINLNLQTILKDLIRKK